MYNASSWLPDCLRSICCQNKGKLKIEISVFNDGSTDDSLEIIKKWQPVLEAEGLKIIIGEHNDPPKGGMFFLLVQSYF